jgi:CRISPR-associated exonuclease Cas4
MEREATQGSSGEVAEAPSRHASKSSYFVLEEPELYLHPQAQRELFDSLVELSKGDSQVLLCTHSSSFISLDRYPSICIVRKNTIDEGTTILQCTEGLFAEPSDKDLFNLTYWVNPDRGELFFARKVILTEGLTEKTVIPLLAGKLGIFRHDFTVIDCGSKDSMPSYLQLLNKFRIPYVTVFDRDHQAGKSADAIASADKTSAKVRQNVDNAIGKTIILENDIEKKLGITDPSNINKPYFAVEYAQEEGFALHESLRSKVASIYS